MDLVSPTVSVDAVYRFYSLLIFNVSLNMSGS